MYIRMHALKMAVACALLGLSRLNHRGTMLILLYREYGIPLFGANTVSGGICASWSQQINHQDTILIATGKIYHAPLSSAHTHSGILDFPVSGRQCKERGWSAKDCCGGGGVRA